MDNEEIDKALKETFKLISEINVYIDNQAPWNLKKSDKFRMNIVLSVSIELIKRSTFLLFPIMPSSCLKVFNILNLDFYQFNFHNFTILPEEKSYLNKVYPIFPRIDFND